ncbi:hypothetical protein DPMN_009065 [Dreissena polymorpha]|uniref:Uncharacterized protein n=1 Tax=Dreissena polymorpha TaxID=45954 RepID=A0A9D4S097_DREPO|nr:hypothetical protein DPMN_009065 [Dreissena polymorpha]
MFVFNSPILIVISRPSKSQSPSLIVIAQSNSQSHSLMESQSHSLMVCQSPIKWSLIACQSPGLMAIAKSNVNRLSTGLMVIARPNSQSFPIEKSVSHISLSLIVFSQLHSLITHILTVIQSRIITSNIRKSHSLKISQSLSSLSVSHSINQSLSIIVGQSFYLIVNQSVSHLVS